MDFTTIFLGVGGFSVVVIALVFILLAAKSKLVSSGNVSLVINGKDADAMSIPAGDTVLNSLSSQKIFIPSACGGGGTCGQCLVQIDEGGGTLLPTEETHINRGMAKENWRLGCQVKIKQDMKLRVDESVFNVQKWECEVVSNRNVATFIKEFVVQLPEGEEINYESGGYIQIEIPPHNIDYTGFEVENEYREDWDTFKLWNINSTTTDTVERAYSMASYPAEGNRIMLNVRIATPPPRTEGLPTGKGSSYIFNQKPGDKVIISGPYGEFFLKDNDREMVFVGGGAGMAPMRSHLLHLFKTLKTDKKVTFWYGARSLREAFYVEEFDEIAKDFPNFEWHLALSDPLPEDNWKGKTGFIHQVLLDSYLANHEAPEECQYYMCGPPMMNSAVINMLGDLGVEPEDIFLDDFGG
ncbi:MAG: NADH:ubiquinone reductase (Na(+)-transporting) subunit F [Planctomycetes bacterium]|nr:NADH:ubiquinone reductase (Na(+)-transporting) subunit F [Planctomycetota bacterium]MCP4859940.1 NADH:ubiquinone reductase (Na(+)-transporting) subunit F [Planctomycetota bacterium]